MSKMLVVVFGDEKSAYEGSKALIDLHREGSLSLYAGAVVERDASGKVTIKDDVGQGPIGTAIGMMTGALIGILAGPQGIVVGAAAGGLVGSVGDLINLGVGSDFLGEVSSRLEPGKFAVVAEIGENFVTPVDTRMEALGGVVHRRYRVDVEGEQIERDIEASRQEWQDLKDEIKSANESNKAKLQAKLDSTKSRIQEAGDRAKAKRDAVQQEGEAKVKAIEQQISSAKAEAKEKLEARKAEIRKDYAARSAKLKEAWELSKEALT
jgi:uncharacterized membrane protein